MQCSKQVSERCACQFSGRSLPNKTSSSTPGGITCTLRTTVNPLLTSVVRSPRYYSHFFCRLAKTAIYFLVKKKPSLIRPNFFGPLVTVLTEFHCIMFVLNTALKSVNMVGKGSYEQTSDTG